MKKYFDILGLEEGISSKEIKKKYRELALVHHPDKGGDEEEFKKITEAYEVLTGKSRPKHTPPNGFGGFGFDINLGDIFGQQERRPPTRDEEVGMGINISIADIKKGIEHKVSYTKSKDCSSCNGLGGEKKTTCDACSGSGQAFQSDGFIRLVTICSNCRGRGTQVENPCKDCDAKGYVKYEEKITFEIRKKK